MTINQDTLTGKWKEIKGEIQKKWGEVTESDVDATKGNAQSLVGLLQQKLGVAKEEATRHIHELTERYKGEFEGVKKDAFNKTNEKIDTAKTHLKN